VTKKLDNEPQAAPPRLLPMDEDQQTGASCMRSVAIMVSVLLVIAAIVIRLIAKFD
jgi:hypothetical protein